MATKKSTLTTAVKAPKKPTPERRTKEQRLLGQELQAHYLEVGLTACEDIRHVWLALNALMLTLLWNEDEEDQRIGNIMRFPVRRLADCVKEFPDLKKARKELEDLQTLNDKGAGQNQTCGAPLVDTEMRNFLRS